MPDHRAPKDGDFAAYLDGRGKAQPLPQEPQAISAAERVRQQQTDHPTEEDLLEQEADRQEALEIASWSTDHPMGEVPPLTDEELERQALSDPGADGDASTPE